MINRENIRHGAILKPQVAKNGRYYGCKSMRLKGQHDYATLDNGNKQCVECGKITKKEPQ